MYSEEINLDNILDKGYVLKMFIKDIKILFKWINLKLFY